MVLAVLATNPRNHCRRTRYLLGPPDRPPSSQVHLTTPFEAGEFEPFGHRGEIRRVIVEEAVVEAALALVDSKTVSERPLIEPEKSSSTADRVSLRALLGKPPYGTV